MELAHRWLNHRLSMVEGIMAWLLIALIIGLFSRYVLEIFSKAEQSMLNSTVANINTALNYQAAFYLLNNEHENLINLESSNPMDKMQSAFSSTNPFFEDEKLNLNNIVLSAPANYVGEINSFTLPSMEKGKWYFDQDNQNLIYRVSNTEFFSSDAEGIEMIRFRVTIDFKDSNFNNRYDPKIDEFRMIKLDSVNSYQWDY